MSKAALNVIVRIERTGDASSATRFCGWLAIPKPSPGPTGAWDLENQAVGVAPRTLAGRRKCGVIARVNG